MFRYIRKLSEILNKIPGEKYFGLYRFLPIFFFSGMALEFAMIHWRPLGINFYDRFKPKLAHKIAEERYNSLKEIEKLMKDLNSNSTSK